MGNVISAHATSDGYSEAGIYWANDPVHNKFSRFINNVLIDDGTLFPNAGFTNEERESGKKNKIRSCCMNSVGSSAYASQYYPGIHLPIASIMIKNNDNDSTKVPYIENIPDLDLEPTSLLDTELTSESRKKHAEKVIGKKGMILKKLNLEHLNKTECNSIDYKGSRSDYNGPRSFSDERRYACDNFYTEFCRTYSGNSRNIVDNRLYDNIYQICTEDIDGTYRKLPSRDNLSSFPQKCKYKTRDRETLFYVQDEINPMYSYPYDCACTNSLYGTGYTSVNLKPDGINTIVPTKLKPYQFDNTCYHSAGQNTFSSNNSYKGAYLSIQGRQNIQNFQYCVNSTSIQDISAGGQIDIDLINSIDCEQNTIISNVSNDGESNAPEININQNNDNSITNESEEKESEEKESEKKESEKKSQKIMIQKIMNQKKKNMICI